MSKRIEVQKPDGTKDVYESSLLTGYHKRETEQGTCIVRKEFNSIPDMLETGRLTKETPVRCYGERVETQQEDCPVCKTVNPTQQDSPPS